MNGDDKNLASRPRINAKSSSLSHTMGQRASRARRLPLVTFPAQIGNQIVRIHRTIHSLFLSLSLFFLSFNSRLENYKRAIAPPLIIALSHIRSSFIPKKPCAFLWAVLLIYGPVSYHFCNRLTFVLFLPRRGEIPRLQPRAQLQGESAELLRFNIRLDIRVRPNRFQPENGGPLNRDGVVVVSSRSREARSR